MTTTQQSILRAIVLAVLVIGVCSFVIRRNERTHKPMLVPSPLEASTVLRFEQSHDGTNWTQGPSITNKPAVRWSELTEVGVTNSPICK
jgi:hypothetical protein